MPGSVATQIASMLGYVPISEEQAAVKQVSTLQTQNGQLQSQISTLQAQISSLNKTIAQRNSTISGLDATDKSQLAQISSLKSQNASDLNKINSLTKSIASLQATISANNSTISSLKSQLTTDTGKISSLTAEVSTLTSQLSSANGAISRLQAQISLMQSSLSADVSQITSLKSQLASEIGKYNSLLTLYNNLLSEISKYKAEALHVIASPSASATSGYIPFNVNFLSGISSTPLQVPSTISHEYGSVSKAIAGYDGGTYPAGSRTGGTIGGTSPGGTTTTTTTTTTSVLFKQSGLPSSQQWTVKYNGKTQNAFGNNQIEITDVPVGSTYYISSSGYTASPGSGKVSLYVKTVNVSFSPVSTTPPSGTTTKTTTPPSETTSPSVSVVWSFGDGSTSTETNPGHVYGTVGTFTPSVTITAVVNGNTYVKTFVLPPIRAALRIPSSINIGPAQSQGNCNNLYKITFLDISGKPCAYSPYVFIGNNLIFPAGHFIGTADQNGNASVILHQCVCGVSGFKVYSILDPTVSNTASGQPPC